MTSPLPLDPLDFGPIAGAAEEEALRDILLECFALPSERWKQYHELLGPENFRAVRRGGRVLGGLGIYWMGQWFGGRSVRMGGIAAVGVAPESRAGGVARTLMLETLRELRSEGTPLSTLFAATQYLYRSVGYEQAGWRCEYAVPAPMITVRDRSLPMERIDPVQIESLRDLYNGWAKAGNGLLDRNRAIWERAVRPSDAEPIHVYRIGPADGPEGYLAFSQIRKTSGYDLFIRDRAALTPGALRRLLSFLADHRSLAREIRWFGPPVEPFFCLLDEQSYRAVQTAERWMLRIVDAARALEERGYPGGLETELDLEIEDDLLPENAGRFVLTVSDGRGRVTTGGKGDLKTGPRGLAALYSGFMTPRELTAAGWIDAGETAGNAASLIFAGPQPWMPDGF